MAFLTVLLVLFIERALWDGAPHRQHGWFRDYLARIGAGNGGWLTQKPWGAIAVVAPPLVVIGWLQVSLLPALGDFFEFAFAALVLLFSLGPRDLGRDVDSYLKARDSGDRAQAARLANAFTPNTPDPDSDRAVINGILQGACRRLIGPLLWFVLFGPVGAAAYRLSRLASEHLADGQDPLAPLARSANGLEYVMDWAPVRVTAAGYAVAGNFDAVAASWKHCGTLDGDADCPNDDALLVETGLAALDQPGSRPSDIVIEDSLALVWRNLTLWVAFAGAVSLFAAL